MTDPNEPLDRIAATIVSNLIGARIIDDNERERATELVSGELYIACLRGSIDMNNRTAALKGTN